MLITVGSFAGSADSLLACAIIAGLAVAVIGVPHGGLDHKTGRRVLGGHFPRSWWLIFFAGYLLVALTVTTGWFISPAITLLTFFILSAWHFGREDQLGEEATTQSANVDENPKQGACFHPTLTNISRHIFALATGGLVIWVPAIFRGGEMESLLQLILASHTSDIAPVIVQSTQTIAFVALPVATIDCIRKLFAGSSKSLCYAMIATAVVAAWAPILLSFTVYFCGWHSVRGLARLRREERVSVGQFAWQVAPLSFLAVLGIVAGGLWCSTQFATDQLLARESILLRMTFVGLSAIAVPHLFLHELANLIQPSSQSVGATP
jgi:Brp/Blh family beta-carotene 15,15'-monooxygenase